MVSVSVIVPVYNCEKYIARCIKSINRQTYDDYEVLFIDDCGTDNSVQRIEEMLSTMNNKGRIIHHEKNMGPGQARDTGLKNASGKYVVFIDGDDYIRKDFIETYVNAMNGLDVVIGGYIREKGGRFIKKLPDKTKTSAWFYTSACNKMYRLQFLKENDLDFRGIRRYEDEQFTYRTLLKNPKVKIIDYAGYYYVYNDTSITQNMRGDRSHLFTEYAESIEKFYFDVSSEAGDLSRELFEYCIISNTTAAILYNAEGCGISRMKTLYKTYNRLINMIINDSLKHQKTGNKKYHNKYISLKRKIKTEDIKIHYSTWLVMTFRKVKLDKILFYIDSLI